jgi:hypothetical protein
MSNIQINDLNHLLTELTKQEASVINGGMMQVVFPWDYAAYSVCFYAGWAGSAYEGKADPVGASDYCHDRYVSGK